MKKLLISSLLAFLLIGLFSCKSNDEDIKLVESKITVNKPSLENVKLKNLTTVFKNRNTNIEYKRENILDVEFNHVVPEGFYNIVIEGEATYTLNSEEKIAKVIGYKADVELLQNKNTVSIDLFVQEQSYGLVIEELYLSGSLKPDGKNYLVDSYFKITNNSFTTLYADGICVLESSFYTNSKREYTPDIMSTHFAVSTVYAIPGDLTTKKYPIEPGKSIIIADRAINHLEANVNSVDLSKADFEWYDEGTDDIDNPNVPNLERIYCYSKTRWTPSIQGNRTYAIAHLGVDKQTFLKDYLYEYSYTVPNKTITYKHYKIPNDWIIDAVNVSFRDEFAWILVHPSLDKGWTYWNLKQSDKTGRGTASRRRMVKFESLNVMMLQDTNDSGNDFEVRVKPSLAK